MFKVDCTSTKTCPTSSLQCVQSSQSSTKFVCCGKDCTPDGKVDHCHGRKEEHCSGECCKGKYSTQIIHAVYDNYKITIIIKQFCRFGKPFLCI